MSGEHYAMEVHCTMNQVFWAKSIIVRWSVIGHTETRLPNENLQSKARQEN